MFFAVSDIRADAGTTSAAFLKIGASARNIALANTGAVNRDVNSIYYNPSGLMNLEQGEFSLMQVQWFQKIYFQHAAIACPGKNQTFAASIDYLSVGEMLRYDLNNNLSGTFNPYDSAGTLGYAFLASEKIFGGFAFKFINSTIDDVSANSYAADIGVTYKYQKNITFGAVVQNMGSGLKYVKEEAKLPLAFKAGGEYYWEYRKNVQPTFYVEVAQFTELDPYISLACETKFIIKEDLGYFLRAGYRTRDKYENLVGLAAGGGFFINGLSIDFAWAPYGELGDTYALSINYKFNKFSNLQI